MLTSSPPRRRRPSLLPLLAVLPVLLAGIWLGGHPEHLPGPLRDGLVGDDETRVIAEAMDEIRGAYYEDVSERRLANAAVSGMVQSLGDQFSAYFSPREYQQFKQAQDPEFSGVGLSVREHPRGLRVVEVFDDSPAKRARIEVGDVVIAADGKSLRGRDERASVALIKGEPGTAVVLTVVHRGKARRERITRATIDVPVVASRMRNVDDTPLASIRLAQFSSGAHGELAKATRSALRRGAKGLVLDLRGNGGGLVSEAQLVASAFLRDGEIVTTRGRSVPTRTLTATGDPVAGTTPLVVLVDRNTASASEIVAGALQDRDRATLVGTRTFGKGVFQQVIELSNGGALDITAGQYFTPAGRNLGGKGTKTGDGLVPDVRARDDADTVPDEALRRALRVLEREVRDGS